MDAENSVLDSKHFEEMLDFERQMFLEILEKDGLLVCAKGLTADTIITNLLRVYCDSGNLIIVLNSSDFEEDYYKKKLNSEDVHCSTFQVAQNKREDIYLHGGIHFITTRILVVDLLKKRIPIEKITGIIVLRAHSVLESCQEAFVLRLYRQRNKHGFIKAFSNCAQSFTIGFGHVERIMRALFVKELFLWPRFHSLVVQDLKKYQPTVIELHVPISKTLLSAQTCILDLINNTVKELKRLNKNIDMQEITTENCITKKFHKILQAQLDTCWYQLSNKTKQIIADLKTLRHLITLMIHSDPVTFYSSVSKYMTQEYAMSTTWVMTETADQLFLLVRELVYKGKASEKELHPQSNPKWEALIEILQQDIPADVLRLKEKHEIADKIKVLILCNDTKTCFHLNQILTYGIQKYLFLMALRNRVPFNNISPELMKSVNISFENSKKDTVENKIAEIFNEHIDQPKKAKVDENITIKAEDFESLFSDETEDQTEELRSNYVLKMSQANCNKTEISMKEAENKSDDLTSQLSQFNFEPFPELENMDLSMIEIDDPLIVIQTFKNNSCSLALKKTLIEMQPNYVIMYHSDITSIRHIEMYEAKNKCRKPLKIYFLIHSDTVEEQSYLTTLRREKQAFEFLIETKSKMVVPDYQDGKSDECFALQSSQKVLEKNTRKAGGQEKEVETITPRIIVDMREFRSELPALIHKRGIDVEPVTITIGDYILTPEICIERKSISDLIQSLNSGRLYSQCVQMSRAYSQPMLLIEFDQNKPFQFQSNFMISTDVNSNDIQQKLQLLTIHFPKLKLIWSPSPYATAQLFEEMKENRTQPDVETVLQLNGETDLESIEKSYNSVIYDFVQKLPGVNSKNIHGLMRKGKKLDDILKMSIEDLKEILGTMQDAKAFFSALHDKHDLEKPVTGKQNQNNKGMRFRGKNRFYNKSSK